MLNHQDLPGDVVVPVHPTLFLPAIVKAGAFGRCNFRVKSYCPGPGDCSCVDYTFGSSPSSIGTETYATEISKWNNLGTAYPSVAVLAASNTAHGGIRLLPKSHTTCSKAFPTNSVTTDGMSLSFMGIWIELMFIFARTTSILQASNGVSGVKIKSKNDLNQTRVLGQSYLVGARRKMRLQGYRLIVHIGMSRRQNGIFLFYSKERLESELWK